MELAVNPIRTSIINVAVEIVRKEGWKGLSMRKIAAQMKCSATTIYGYFSNKNALMAELVKLGFLNLTKAIAKVIIPGRLPSQQLEEIWIAYSEYARKEKELYKVMFGAGTVSFKLFEASTIAMQIKDMIRRSLKVYSNIDERVSTTYDILWALAHGFATTSLRCSTVPASLYREILVERIRAINN